MESLELILDLGWLLLTAAGSAILFRRLNQPVILGYLLAGLLLGGKLLPGTPLHDLHNIHALSELGVLFLMFYIGLEFDLGKLKPVMGASVLALLFQTVLMTLIGTTVAGMLGWSSVDGLFLSGILSISSSMVTFKLIEERRELGRSYAQYTAGVLILEDILAIILLVVLAGVAVTGRLDLEDVGRTTSWVGMFVVVVFIVGKLLAPRAMGFLHRFGNSETITLFTVGLIMGVSLLSVRFEFSLALGGFMAGAILSRSSLAEEIEVLTAPLRDVFSALFFVAIGTMIDPRELLEHAGMILALSALVMSGKFLACWMGFVLGGVPAAVGTRAAAAKVQIGEFGFIIAALGISLEVTDPAIKAIASGVAMVTILLTPVAVRSREWVIGTARRVVPGGLQRAFEVYQHWLETVRLALRESLFLKMARRPALQVVVYFVLLNALIIAASIVANRIPAGTQEHWRLTIQRLVWIGAAVFSIPLQVAILRSTNVITMMIAELASEWFSIRAAARGALRELLRWGVFSLIMLIYAAAFLVACAPYFSTGVSVTFFVLTCLVLAVAFWRRAVQLQSRIESSLFEALRQHADSAVMVSVEEAIRSISRRNPWPVQPLEIEVPREARVVGRRIRDLRLREETGATIVAIQRAGHVIFDVSPDMVISPHDHVLLLGEPEQLQRARRFMTEPDTEPVAEEILPHRFERVLVASTSDLCGLSLREAGIRARYGVTIVGIQRGEERITRLSPDEVLRDGDLLVVMGRDEDIARLKADLV